MEHPHAARTLLTCLLALGSAPGFAGSASALQSQLVFDVSPLEPAAVGGELFGISSAAGQVVHGRIDATFVSSDPGPWTLSASFALPTGIAGIASETEGWSGVGTFSATLETDAFNGLLAPAEGQSFYPWFVEWVGGSPFTLPGGGVGLQPVDGVFTQLVLTLTLNDGPPGPWADLGHALAGQLGEPQLSGSGNLCRSAPGALLLEDARPGGSAFLVLGFSSLWQAFHGGLLIPAPDVVIAGLPLDGAGSLALPFSFPIGVPGGSEFWVQAWIPDPAAPAGFSASNALLATVPSDC